MLSIPSCQVAFQGSNIGTNNKLLGEAEYHNYKELCRSNDSVKHSLTDNHSYCFIIIYSNYFHAKNPFINIQLFL